jgi:hypothetical protein
MSLQSRVFSYRVMSSSIMRYLHFHIAPYTAFDSISSRAKSCSDSCQPAGRVRYPPTPIHFRTALFVSRSVFSEPSFVFVWCFHHRSRVGLVYITLNPMLPNSYAYRPGRAEKVRNHTIIHSPSMPSIYFVHLNGPP